MTSPTSPKSPSDPHWDRLARYFAGESSREEAAEVERWLAQNPDEARRLQHLEAMLDEPVATGGLYIEGALRKVKTRAMSRTPGWGYAVAGLAAAAAIIAILVIPRASRDNGVPATAETRVATEAGARDTVTLPDGTRITLAPSTRLAVNGHDITLEGEAFFTMAPTKGAPYLVRAGGVTIRDIGTEFGVRAYPSEPLRVVVSSGIVEVKSPSATVVLDSGDVGVVGTSGAVARTADAVTADDVAWMQGRLVFRNASMAALTSDLRRWYGVELHVSDTSLQRRHFTGSFSGEPVTRVADVIALALGARAERRGDTIYIRPARR